MPPLSSGPTPCGCDGPAGSSKPKGSKTGPDPKGKPPVKWTHTSERKAAGSCVNFPFISQGTIRIII
jgi:hypothetical protein